MYAHERCCPGNYLQGTIVGHGDIDAAACLAIIKKSGYDGYISVEFEGPKDCRLGSCLGMTNVKKYWNEESTL